jgi:hypothetical protein
VVVFLKNTLDVRGVAVGYLVVCHPLVEGGERDAATVHYAVAERDCVSLVEDVFVLLSYHCFVVFVSLYKKGGGVVRRFFPGFCFERVPPLLFFSKTFANDNFLFIFAFVL